MGTSVRDLTGQRFGRLTATQQSGVNKFRQATWQCTCDCGSSIVVVSGSLVQGATKSCGCLPGHPNVHGHAKKGAFSATYRSWRCMRARCHTTTDMHYQYYGGRGIDICSRWDSFENFLEDMGERPPGCVLSRTDHSRGYEPGNVRWETAAENSSEVATRNWRDGAWA